MYVSNCCAARDRSASEDGSSYRDMGICPACKEPCLFEYDDEENE